MNSIEHFINGKIVKGLSKRTAKIFNPATGEVSSNVNLASSADLNKAVDAAKKALDEKLKQSANKDKVAIEEANKFQKKLEKLELSISAKVIDSNKLFGSVTSSDISKQLSEEGYEVEKNKIILSSNIKSTGKYSAKVRLHREVSLSLIHI